MIFDVRTDFTPDELTEMNDERIQSLDDAGINEEEVLGKAKENINIWNNYFNENLTRGKDDMNFALRDQWTAVERSEFNRLFKPAFTFNKLYPMTKKVAGEQRKNKPDLLVRSLTGKASQQQIDLRADLIRTISYRSQNDLVYQAAFNSALMMGWGGFQIDVDYKSPNSFDLDINYILIPDITRCSFDPVSKMPHKGDGNYCSRDYMLSKEEFYAQWPYIENPSSYTDTRTLLDFQWETRDSIVVCDYYQKEWYSTLIYKLSNGQVVTPEEWEEMQQLFKVQKEIGKDSQVVGSIIEAQLPKIIDDRKTKKYKIRHYRLIKNQILEWRDWPSKYLPIIFNDGDSHYIEGMQYTRSFIHEAKDAQKFLNYTGSEIAAEVKNRRREQWIGTPDNIIGQEQLWRNPELQNGILIARPDPKTGQLPVKVNAWELSPGLLQQYQRATMDIREILGFSEADQTGSRDISGLAKRERNLQGSIASTVWFDNLNQAIEQGGRVVLDLLPYVMGKDERMVSINKADGSTQNITLNQKMPDGSIQNQLEAGDFDIEIDTGPSFAVQKEIALEMFTQTFQAFPQAFPLIADLWAANLDLQFMPQIKERFQTLVPQNILAKEKGLPPPPPQPDPQQQAMQMQMQLQQAEMQLKQQQVQERGAKLQLEQQQHEIDKAKLMMDVQRMMNDVQVSQSTNDLEKAKLLVELKRIQADINSGHADRSLEASKIALDHHAKMVNSNKNTLS